MIEIEGLTKRYGDKVAVDGLSFTVDAGTVTGFLGPNGAGKSTTMQIIAGLDAPTSGSVRVNGRRHRDSTAPMAELGVLLEARAVHPGRSARNHLRAVGQTAGIGRQRSTRCSSSSGCPTSRTSASAASAWAWRNGSVSPPPCSGGRRPSCWTSR